LRLGNQIHDHLTTFTDRTSRYLTVEVLLRKVYALINAQIMYNRASRHILLPSTIPIDGSECHDDRGFCTGHNSCRSRSLL
jgi:hypothetical protein